MGGLGGSSKESRGCKGCSLLTFVSAKRNMKDSTSAQNIIVEFYQNYFRYRYLYFTIGKLGLKI